ncbi:unnamed protein product [Ectocarpus sp. CCAP 1310/34]|nr:unnamed protein product [Ectocarpus sp. CCAP 1310/34]
MPEALDLCVACRQVPSLVIRMNRKESLYQHAGRNDSPRVPMLWPSAMRGKYVKEALLSEHHKPINCSSASRLELGAFFDKSIISVKWSRSLQKIIFNGLFNQPAVCQLRMSRGRNHCGFFRGPCFNQAIKRVKWSPRMNLDFDQPISKAAWPKALHRLTFGGSFDREIDHVKWPSLLQELEFGDKFNDGVENMSWPDRLKKLTFACMFDQPIERVTSPACLEVLVFRDSFN